MGPRNQKRIVFLCTGSYVAGRCAEALFNSVAVKMGLPWVATSRALAGEGAIKKVARMPPAVANVLTAMRLRVTDELTQAPAAIALDDLVTAGRIVALNQAEHRPLLQERFPAWADQVEYWEIDESLEALARIEHEVMDLTARLIRGGERQTPPPPPDICPHCGQPVSTCTCQPRRPVPRDVTVRVGRETKGRRGKGVTTVSDLPLDESGLLGLAAKLKQRLGTGGTIKDGRIEIQGDQRDRVVAELEGLGYRVKRAGG
jgi:translation initiation factor 1